MSRLLYLLMIAGSIFLGATLLLAEAKPSPEKCGPCRRENIPKCQKDCHEEEGKERTRCFAKCIRAECGIECMRDPDEKPK